MGRVDGKVAFIAGAAHGMGLSDPLRLAKEGADIIAMDLAGPVATVRYPPATRAALEEAVSGVEELGRRVYAYTAHVRDFDARKEGLDAGVAELDGLDVAVANARILNDVNITWGLDEDKLAGDDRRQSGWRLAHREGGVRHLNEGPSGRGRPWHA